MPREAAHSLEAAALEHLGYKALTEEDVCGRGAKAVRSSSAPSGKLHSYAGERADLALQLGGQADAASGRRWPGPRLCGPRAAAHSGAGGDGARRRPRRQRRRLPPSRSIVERELAARTTQIFEIAGEPFNINSPKQLSEILFDKLQLPALKRNVKTKTASTAVEVLEELALAHDLPRLILEWRRCRS